MPPTVKREIRLTKFEFMFGNKSSATILENEIRQYNGKQWLFLHFIVHDKVNNVNVSNRQ